MRHFLSFVVLCLALSGCHRHMKKEVENPFPLKLDLKSYTVVNYIPLRKGENLDHLLDLEKWAQEKAMVAGLQGEGVLGLLEGRASLENHPTDPLMKTLFVDIILSFEFRNQPTYGKGKAYFRLSETHDLTEGDVPSIQKYIHQKLESMDKRFLSVVTSQFPLLRKPS
ncbi:MAG: hypothetical protein A2621_02475 [Alphaproteobacteria bacterium RIFCSPHIGHO2_01_FULL_41_14]|nr:MAG: hypothetical protein A2065_01975 [Alphaproteobacteria bacterium GWB1_45_5]OFW76668.1 MAG: hypothetical protein A3K20_00585 [Alphaproteobacteria bacterium GWA1_45_9]OFW89746.1 MAG: hypothetical protein A2621_02475 [Alphaproteobacteria bacterium RIFCSPHIGHO2_01_FULL_41_14]HCI48416.1 hypothetical protein [Holosporales bacterium]